MLSAKFLPSVLIGLLLALTLGGCASQPVARQAEGPRDHVAVAVWNLENMSVVPSPLLEEMNEYLTARVIEIVKETLGYPVIERERLLAVLEELRLGSSALASDATRLQVGHIVGASSMVFGGYQQVGEQFRVDLRRVDVESGKVLRSGEATMKAGDPTGWAQVVDAAARNL
ncbi:MAG: hypothetical protein BWK76_01310 [Desulfobulbaceae bacterium A2]|nr:MAG: hypothetical protein BWK76_01310 [Desulfobulbaceae bacterium A2]